MLRRILALLLVGVLAPGLGWTGDETIRGWYLGGGVALSNVFANEDIGLYGSSERGSSDTGFVVNGGYRFNRYVAAEIGYLDGAEPQFHSITLQPGDPIELVDTDVVQQTEAYEASLVGIMPFLKIWEIYVKGGVVVWDASSQQVLTPITGGPPVERQVDRDGTDFLVGLGFGVTFVKHVHLRFEYQAFRTHDDLLALTDDREARFDSFIAEVHWRFGNQW